jgi:hypothetical protein
VVEWVVSSQAFELEAAPGLVWVVELATSSRAFWSVASRVEPLVG